LNPTGQRREALGGNHFIPSEVRVLELMASGVINQSEIGRHLCRAPSNVNASAVGLYLDCLVVLEKWKWNRIFEAIEEAGLHPDDFYLEMQLLESPAQTGSRQHD
jgi:hypothetical protein